VTSQGGPVAPRGAWRPATARRGRRPPSARLLLAAAGTLVGLGLAVAWMGQRADAVAQTRPRIVWTLSPAANTVTIRLTPGSGVTGRGVLARSRIVVSEGGKSRLRKAAPGRGTVRVPVPPGTQTQLWVQVKGPMPVAQALTVTVPPRLRVTTLRHTSAGLLIQTSDPLRHQPLKPLCGTDQIRFRAPAAVLVAKSPDACRARIRLTARNGEQATVRVTVAALPKTPLYSFASPAGRAIYITVDDGWTPSSQVLAIMRNTHLPVTAFLIEQAAQRNLAYWRAFAGAGGTIEDHTVSHADLTKLSLSQATSQWAQARLTLGRWLGQAPVMGRPPYGAFDSTVEAAAYRARLKALVGWSATITSAGVRTWNGKRLEPGEIVLLHWVPGLGQQLTKLLAVIHARHLQPMPLTPASFAGIGPQGPSLGGD
jgi:peptidoglycan/xylan/chitin deacetylase (PgdA/CDA1 family)